MLRLFSYLVAIAVAFSLVQIITAASTGSISSHNAFLLGIWSDIVGFFQSVWSSITNLIHPTNSTANATSVSTTVQQNVTYYTTSQESTSTTVALTSSPTTTASSTAESTVGTTETSSAPTTATTTASSNSSASATALYQSVLAKMLTTQNIFIHYSLYYDDEPGILNVYKLGNATKVLIGPSEGTYQEYTEQVYNGSYFQCYPSSGSQPSCTLYWQESDNDRYSISEFGVTQGSSPLNTQLLGFANETQSVGGQYSTRLSYKGTASVAGRTCDMFFIEELETGQLPSNYTICLDQSTGFPLIFNLSGSIGSTTYKTNVIALTVAENASVNDFYPPVSASQSTTTSTSSTSTTSSSTSTGSTTSSTTTINSGSTSDYLTQAQTQALIGTGGGYVAGAISQSQIQALPSAYDITSGSSMWYNITTGPNRGAVHEVIYDSGNATGVYKVILLQIGQGFNQTYLTNEGATNVHVTLNGTYDGMTYSTTSYSIVSQTYGTQNESVFLGAYNGQMIYAIANTNQTFNSQTFFSNIAGAVT